MGLALFIVFPSSSTSLWLNTYCYAFIKNNQLNQQYEYVDGKQI